MTMQGIYLLLTLCFIYLSLNFEVEASKHSEEFKKFIHANLRTGAGKAKLKKYNIDEGLAFNIQDEYMKAHGKGELDTDDVNKVCMAQQNKVKGAPVALVKAACDRVVKALQEEHKLFKPKG